MRPARASWVLLVPLLGLACVARQPATGGDESFPGRTWRTSTPGGAGDRLRLARADANHSHAQSPSTHSAEPSRSQPSSWAWSLSCWPRRRGTAT